MDGLIGSCRFRPAATVRGDVVDLRHRGCGGREVDRLRRAHPRRGYRAYDTDEDEIAQWRNKVTGEITALLDESHRTPEFIAENVWWADPARVRGLAEEAEQCRVFLCGSVGNDDEVRPLFDKVFLLAVDEATMRHRLLTRTSHDFGTRPHELQMLLVWNEMLEAHYVGSGAIKVDATEPLDVVVDEILRHPLG